MSLGKNELLTGKFKSLCRGLFLIGYLATTCGAFLSGTGQRLAQPTNLRISGRCNNPFQPQSCINSIYLKRSKMNMSHEKSTSVSSLAENLKRVKTNEYDKGVSISSLADENGDDDEKELSEEIENEESSETIVPLKDDEEFIAAVNEVKEAAKNITTSSVQFTSAIVTKGPGIFWRLFTTLVEKEIRCV